MATTNEEILDRWTAQTNASLKVAGACLALGSLLLVVGLVFHPPPAPDAAEQMAIVAEGATLWVAVHWVSAAALSLFAVSGLVVLAARSRLTENGWTMAAWGVLTVGALWTMTTAVAEATVIAEAAVSGNAATFEAWEAFANGKAAGVVFLSLAVAVVAGNEARAVHGATPAWAAWLAVVVAVAASAGFVLGMWLGIGLGGVVWVAFTVAMSAWTLWFGVALMRPAGTEEAPSEGAPA